MPVVAGGDVSVRPDVELDLVKARETQIRGVVRSWPVAGSARASANAGLDQIAAATSAVAASVTPQPLGCV